MPRKRLDLRLPLLTVVLAGAVPGLLARQEAASGEAAAQGTAEVLSLPQCIDVAFASGTDIEILLKNLAVSREQYNTAVSQSAYSLSATSGRAPPTGMAMGPSSRATP